MGKYRMRLFIYAFIFIGILAFLGLSCFNTWEQINDNKRQKAELELQYSDLLDKEDTLSGEVVKLQDPEYVAKYAREKYLYTKDGELIIDMTDNEE